MLETATVTLSYKEFQELVEKTEESKEIEKELEKLIDEKLEGEEVKVLDTISNFLIAASEVKTIEEKQEFIMEGIKFYCIASGIPEEELIDIEKK